ncbi:hypothetical protein L1F06_023380 [Ectopseudomonas hydrolytica]|uniref:Uncharacterized protein n=1 Tax=Ectopseudomonas hydrolytica TaxID=2493633 RepID=A0ABY5A6R6_9GAMM|nr:MULTISPECIES: hypothetical protein [Pseudomonas]MDH0097446.1 hypothetical protein [Pseudomonas sp. GD04158]USR39564.1 hypothetical protein L1F06_023380 [Pseudomonas hydrolytica]
MWRVLKYLSWALGALFSLTAVILFHLAGGGTIVHEYFRHDPPEELEFSFGLCESEPRKPTRPEEILWKENTATINVILSPNCGTTWLLGNYKVEEGSKLVLGYKSIVPSIIGCDCNYPATYRIKGLENKEYEIELREYAFINKVPWLMQKIADMDQDIVITEEF